MASVELSMNLGPPHPSEVIPVHSSSSRPSLGFPLGTGLLLVVIFTLSVVFSCCYHWDKLRSLFRPSSASAATSTLPVSNTDVAGSDKSSVKIQGNKQEKDESLPVIMPGDQIPKFMARPCQCQRKSSCPTDEGDDLSNQQQGMPEAREKAAAAAAAMVEVVVISESMLPSSTSPQSSTT